jgi:hypothetical protein
MIVGGVTTYKEVAMTNLEAAAVFGAEALAKVDAGVPTTPAEDKIVLMAISREVRRGVEAEQAAATIGRELIPA